MLARSGTVRAWFYISFGVTAIIACWIGVVRHTNPAPGIFERLFLSEDFAGAYILLGVILLGLLPSVQRAGASLARTMGDHPVATATITAAVLAVAARLGYLAHPLAMDEYAAVFQSKAFAAGRLCGHFPPGLLDWLIPPSFQNVFLITSRESGCVASAYWPGMAALLTPFSAIGAPWLCNPVIGGLTVLVLHRLALDLCADRTAAGFVVLLTVASTAFTINAISFYSMPAHLLFNALFAVCMLRQQVVFAFLAGLAGGWALVLHNPFPHALFAAPWVVWLLLQKNRFALLAAMLAGYAPFVFGPGLQWMQFLQELKASGSATTPIAAGDSATDAVRALWRAAGWIFQWPSPEVLSARLIGLAKLWLWATPGLVALAIHGFRRRRSEAPFLLLGAAAFTTFFGYLFYPESQGHGWGFRYFHSAWLILPLLATAELFGEGKDRQALRNFAAGCALAALVTMNLLRVYQAHSFISDHLEQLPAEPPAAPGLQIIETSTGYYTKDLVQNDPLLRNPSWRMVSHGMKQDAAMVAEHFPAMTLLSNDDRGSTWGSVPPRQRGDSTTTSVGRGEHDQQE